MSTDPDSSERHAAHPRGMSRRRLLGIAGGGTLGIVAAGATGGVLGRATAGTATAPVTPGSDAADAIPFTGRHQAGIVTPAQDRLHFVALDVTTHSRDDLVEMLKTWTEAARRMTAGQDAGPVGAVDGNEHAAPDDTGGALGLPASGLTLTIGFGPTLFTTTDGRDRFGLAARKPAALVELPEFAGDRIDPAISGGDLCVQACANDPQVAVHAVRNIVRLGAGVVSVRWSQLGFGRTSSTSTKQATPRNLMGFKDGTNNLKAENGQALDRFVWVAPGDGGPGADWLAGGSYLVTRRIRMLVEDWDAVPLGRQEAAMGRRKGSGAPLGQRAEFDPVDLTQVVDGNPAIPADSHVALSNPTNAGTAILRRGYSFVDGSDGSGRLDAGLFFIAYQRNPETGFVQVQRNLAGDALNQFIEHTSSAVFACPPGVESGDDWWGRALFT
ncbi:deferrochelatase/peroxidase EfeB [Blastococcus sp. MG754426]|uniref:iron uptake transporter deferrochelatase/peroxidase subunit n=1 Tax=unclassified Blastococcus TaxID=2619396 RepID=UPI0021042359|nr:MULTISPECIES: iron uptake transporter deferrochelatase/peroxidase subunit [unclassified Blastococcus]MCF6507787.1 deferrochelatase/peroxidase EfeB [Blastococcus sp. MG754426]MCF6510206.1 deferrochelatase/peroxidase EfeB [Blastococcus sp. MG754427]MCF6735872.1 deferrochelatase/peroxidase EfeB [Blastococcus sp. KM273129]